MRRKLFVALWLIVQSTCIYAQQQDSLMLRRIYSAALTRGECYSNLDYLSNRIGGRLSGSPQAQQAVEYTFQKLKSYGFDTVYLQEVMVPHWVRGAKEVAYFSKGDQQIRVRITALGNSVGTGPKGIKAPVIEVQSINELAQLGVNQIKGKIVFFNRPMNPEHIHTGRAYGEAGDQRGQGPAEAARYGAVGVVVRSLTLALDTNPHTGMTRYNDSLPAIPACAISTVDAEALSSYIEIALCR